MAYGDARSASRYRTLLAASGAGQQLTVALIGNPMSAHEMAVMHASRTFGFVFCIDSEQVVRDLRECGTVSFSVEQACIELELSTVIVGQVVAVGRRVSKPHTALIVHLVPQRARLRPYCQCLIFTVPRNGLTVERLFLRFGLLNCAVSIEYYNTSH